VYPVVRHGGGRAKPQAPLFGAVESLRKACVIAEPDEKPALRKEAYCRQMEERAHPKIVRTTYQTTSKGEKKNRF